MIKILSWNVNGIRACLEKGFAEWLEKSRPDILGIQEVKAKLDQLPKKFTDTVEKLGYSLVWNPAQKPGYSGTALFSKLKILKTELGLGDPRFDGEGRTIVAKIDHPSNPFTIYNIYFPNGQMNEERLKFKLDFYDAFLEHVRKAVKRKENVVVMGDVNTAHKEIDLKNPRENEDYSGFLPVERAWIDKFISKGYVDTFRHFHKEPDQYSWWTYRFNARSRNVGWRIDYVFVNRDFLPQVKDGFILPDVKGSDHCPVGILLK